MKRLKHLFPLLFLLPTVAAFSQQYGVSVGQYTTNGEVYTNRDFRLFVGWHLSKKFVMMPEIGVRHIGYFGTRGALFSGSSSPEFQNFTQPILGLLMTTPFLTADRRNVFSLGGGFDLLPGRLYLNLDWTRYRLGGSYAGFRVGLQPGFGGNPAFRNGFLGSVSNSPILTTLGLRIDFFHYVLPRELRK